MKVRQISPHYWVLGLIFLAALVRLLPHLPNVTPVGAIALFGGAYIGRSWYWLLPIATLVVSDWLIGWYSPLVMGGVYFGFIAAALIGRLLLWQRVRWPRVLGAVGVGALTFWIISNFAVWLAHYPPTLAGLSACYVNALPFLGLSLMGDLIYSLLLFGLFRIAISDSKPDLYCYDPWHHGYQLVPGSDQVRSSQRLV